MSADGWTLFDWSDDATWPPAHVQVLTYDPFLVAAPFAVATWTGSFAGWLNEAGDETGQHDGPTWWSFPPAGPTIESLDRAWWSFPPAGPTIEALD